MISHLERNALLCGLILALGASLVRPFDMLTWFLETAPVIAGLPILVFTFKRFPLTPLAYRLLFLHALILILGAHYSYARVPLGFWLQDVFEFSRNNYDRLGHIAQGFVPAIVARELLLRLHVVARRGWLFVIVVCICLAISAFYELIEWWVALAAGQASTEFLGTQGDPWDTQWDMFLALGGALVALLTLAKPHDKSLARLAQ